MGLCAFWTRLHRPSYPSGMSLYSYVIQVTDAESTKIIPPPDQATSILGNANVPLKVAMYADGDFSIGGADNQNFSVDGAVGISLDLVAGDEVWATGDDPTVQITVLLVGV
jgi:hypothetical protein